MKIKKIIKFLLVALIVNILAFFLFTINGYDMIYKAVKNFSVAEMDYSSQDFLEKAYKTNLIYIYKEFPGVSLNYDVLLENVKHLQSRFGLKYIIYDITYTESLWLNMYLKDQSVDVGDIVTNRELMNFIMKIIEYNEFLPERDKLEFVGINMDESKELSVKYIDYVFDYFSMKRKPQIINNVHNFTKRDLNVYYQNMYNSLLENERLYKEYFIDKYFSLYMTLRNYLNNSENIRAENLSEIFAHNLRARYYGQLADISFIDTLKDKNNIFLSQFIYDNCESIYDDFVQYPFDLNDSGEPKVYILNNWILKYFEKYRAFVYKINNEPYESYDTTLGSKYIILTNSPAIEVIYD